MKKIIIINKLLNTILQTCIFWREDFTAPHLSFLLSSTKINPLLSISSLRCWNILSKSQLCNVHVLRNTIIRFLSLTIHRWECRNTANHPDFHSFIPSSILSTCKFSSSLVVRTKLFYRNSHMDLSNFESNFLDRFLQ